MAPSEKRGSKAGAPELRGPSVLAGCLWCPMHRGTFSSIPGLCPGDAHSPPPHPHHCDNHTSPGDGATATPSRTTSPKVSLGFPSRSSLCLRLTPPHCRQMGPCSPSCWGLGPSVSPSECLYFRFFRAEGSECKWVKPSTQMLHFSGSQFSRL